MQLLVTMNDDKQWQQVLEGCQLEKWNSLNSLESAVGAKEEASYCVSFALSLAEVESLLVQSDTHILLCLSAPETFIGQQIQQGEPINKALEAWCQQTTAILQLQTQHRRKLQLVQTEAILFNPSGSARMAVASLSTFEP